ncbi:MAG: chemotaxis protein CheX [Deltaproteobacteria bacterium HGW-Deltaproteobacteria-18]|nr:MAG: chemotaxis protein CheX [Deltaproteobacteria bacterium HGW-Deltaproteobacteria-18]
MSPDMAKPFISATKHVLSAAAALEVVAGPPYVKKDKVACGCVSALIGITGDRKGTFCISFDKNTAVHIVRQMLGDAIEDVVQDVQDAMGEITNMISGHARVGLVDLGLKLQGSTPSVIMGDNHSISYRASAQAIAIPFSCQAGKFTLEFCFD